MDDLNSENYDETNYNVKILGGPDEIDLSLQLSLDLRLRSKENTKTKI